MLLWSTDKKRERELEHPPDEERLKRMAFLSLEERQVKGEAGRRFIKFPEVWREKDLFPSLFIILELRVTVKFIGSTFRTDERKYFFRQILG